MANPPGTRIDIAVCQKHGLRYNRAIDTGCAVCRRDGEVAEPAPPPPTAAPPPRPRPVAATPPPRPSPRATGAFADAGPAIAAAAEPSPSTTAARAVEIATCDKHGLRYNRATDKGCARCRAESGAAGGARRGPAAGRAAVEAPASLRTQLLIAALLVGGTGGLFFAAHQSVLESFAGGILATAGEAGAEAAAAPGDASYEAPDPAAWPPPRPTGSQPQLPPGMRGRGPAEQQKQIEELMRQMKEDEEKERGAALPGESEDEPQ